MNAIVVGADGSAESLRALAWAADEARLRRCPLRIVHAIAPWLNEREVDPRLVSVREWLLADAQEIIGAAVEAVRARAEGVEVTGETVPGGAARVLLEQARDASLVVVGGHGVGTVAGLLLGSTALQVVSHTAAPTVVVRHLDSATRHEIAVGVEGLPVGEPALAFAFEEAALRGARLRAVHVWSDPGTTGAGGTTPLVYNPEQVAAEHTRRLREALTTWREKYPEVEVVIEVVHGRPVRILSGASARADLLVVGTRGHGGFAGLVLGSVSHGLLHHTNCPLAVVPSTSHP